jgi:hypothetical protein
MFVLCQALVGGQSPESLLEKDFLITIVVIETLPLLTQTSRDNSRAGVVHFSHRASKRALRSFAAAVTLPALGSWVGLFDVDRLELKVVGRAVYIAILRYNTLDC